MSRNQEVEITTHDRLLRAWENSMELVRDFENYSKEIKDNKQVSEIFAQFAVDEGLHAAKFRDVLLDYQNN